MTRFLPLILAAAAFVAAPALAQDQGRIDVDHNGSGMAVLKRDDWVRIKYVTPKPSLVAAGINKDTRNLFEGYMQGPTEIRGYAVAFKKRCFPAEYEVAGTVDPVTGTITLDATKGGPVWGQGCDFTLSPESKHIHLVFTGEPAQVADLFPLPEIEPPTAAAIAEIMAPAPLEIPAPPAEVPVEVAAPAATVAVTPIEVPVPVAPAPAPLPTPSPVTPKPAPVVKPVEKVEQPAQAPAPKPKLDIDF